MSWLWILAALAAFFAIQAWAWRNTLSWPYETCEGDEDARQTHQIDAHGDFEGRVMVLYGKDQKKPQNDDFGD